MKFGPFDGSTEEVRDLIENNGLNLEDYLEKAPIHLKTRYLVIPGILFFISILTLCLLFDNSPPYLLRLLYISCFGFGTWICASSQIRFKNSTATFCIAIGIIIITLLAAGLISPKEAATIVKEMKK